MEQQDLLASMTIAQYFSSEKSHCNTFFISLKKVKGGKRAAADKQDVKLTKRKTA